MSWYSTIAGGRIDIDLSTSTSTSTNSCAPAVCRSYDLVTVLRMTGNRVAS